VTSHDAAGQNLGTQDVTMQGPKQKEGLHMTVPQRFGVMDGLADFEKLGFAQLVTAGDFVFVSGQTGIDKDWKVVGSDFETQARQVFENLRIALESVGSGLDQIVIMTAFFAHPGYVPVFGKIRSEVMSGVLCASTAICGVSFLLPELLLEVEVTAVRRSTKEELK
jgi:enamine deaminase RidA (YjgF/YER057c/UK114 family)